MNPYSPTADSCVTRPKHRLTSSIWTIVVPTAIACVVGSFFFRSYFASVGDPKGGSISAGLTGLVVLPFVLLIRHAMRTWRSQESSSESTAFVEDGYERVCDAIEADIRPEIERKYADEWNASGLVKRWFLLRRIEREISARVAEQSQHISPTSLF